ncbi:MAG TPA: hypothetical protein ENK66_01815, partial [Arcobacter sp.]|nr:hypothetical protein [Arcobacter sp.]
MNDNELVADKYSIARIHYNIRFKKLLKNIYNCYEIMITDGIELSKNENKIRDILVDKYLSSKIKKYEFKKEEDNNLGRVDIYIIDTFEDKKPNFIIECKLLDEKNLKGKDGLNGKYIQNGIFRFLTEHYFLENNFKTNSMIAFIVANIDIENNIADINELSKKNFNNLVEITQKITLDEENIYKSSY